MMKMVTENWFLKLLSLTFALILWFFVMGEQRLEQGFSASLQLRNMPEGLMIANEVPSTIDVRISGPRTLLMNLKPNDVNLSVDLKGLTAGVTTFKRLEEQLNLPTAMKVTRLSPSAINVKLEPVWQKKLPVRVVLSGTLPDGVDIATVTAQPAYVEVEGARSEIRDVVEVLTDPVIIDGATETIALSVPLNLVGQYVSLREEKNVQVTVTLVTDITEPQNARQEKLPE